MAEGLRQTSSVGIEGLTSSEPGLTIRKFNCLDDHPFHAEANKQLSHFFSNSPVFTFDLTLQL
jgi:hypothetical protein